MRFDRVLTQIKFMPKLASLEILQFFGRQQHHELHCIDLWSLYPNYSRTLQQTDCNRNLQQTLTDCDWNPQELCRKQKWTTARICSNYDLYSRNDYSTLFYTHLTSSNSFGSTFHRHVHQIMLIHFGQFVMPSYAMQLLVLIFFLTKLQAHQFPIPDNSGTNSVNNDIVADVNTGEWE